jgi:hypothetical protein
MPNGNRTLTAPIPTSPRPSCYHNSIDVKNTDRLLRLSCWYVQMRWRKTDILMVLKGRSVEAPGRHQLKSGRSEADSFVSKLFIRLTFCMVWENRSVHHPFKSFLARGEIIHGRRSTPLLAHADEIVQQNPTTGEYQNLARKRKALRLQ